VIEHSTFSIPVRAPRTLDLTEPPFAASEAQWSDPDDYSACQAFASAARKIDTQLIRYRSARDPDRRANAAILDPAAFAAAAPTIEQTWHFRYEAGRMTALGAFPSTASYTFTFGQFGLDDQ
jgi:hypothetical protein